MATAKDKAQERMAALRSEKEGELSKVQQMQADCRKKIAEADQNIKTATRDMNITEYEAAKQEKQKAQTALEMYNGRYDQLQHKEYITEADSDKVIDSLLEYEQALAADFKKKVATPLKALNKLLQEYKDEVADTEKTIKDWNKHVYPNFTTRGATLHPDPETGKFTDRSATPVPVHRLPYTGCSEATQLETFLNKHTALWTD